MLICKDWLKNYPHELISALSYAARCHQVEMYFAGGAVRDWICGKDSYDLDVTVNAHPFEVARSLAEELGGSFVPLDDEEGVARVAWRMDIDISSFREGATHIVEDLCRRDFTINAMAVKFDPALPGLEYPYDIIDPTGGADDLRNGIIRAVSESVFVKDPLRLIRAYRFMASFGFALDPVTKQLIRKCSGLIGSAATERISYEMERIMASDRASDVIAQMAEIGLVWKIFPELERGVGCKQPASHHLDVFSHNLETLRMMEQLQQSPAEYFPGHGRELKEYLEQKRRRVWLRWAAFFHDIAKPETYELRDGRRTFYNHDRSGGRKFSEVARRLHWSNDDTDHVARFISLHMWPFHLNNSMRKTGITAKACLRLVKTIGSELPGLFLLAMADSLAGQGVDKPENMEISLAELYGRVDAVCRKSVLPVLQSPPLLTGTDLVDLFDLQPGPIFGTILSGIEKARVVHEGMTRDDAVGWVRVYLKGRGQGTGG